MEIEYNEIIDIVSEIRSDIKSDSGVKALAQLEVLDTFVKKLSEFDRLKFQAMCDSLDSYVDGRAFGVVDE